jgi:HAE1 family hydrophobic/amphiphilic exporter-1
MDMGTAVISIELPPATNLKETEHYVDQIIDIAKEYPEVQRVLTMGGSSGTGMMFGTSQGSNSATLLIRLVDAAKRKKSAIQIANEILQKAPVYQGATVKSMDLVNTLFFGGAGKPVEISLYGEDLEELSSLANTVAEEIGKIKGITGVEISLKKAKPELRINILRDKAAYFGLTPIQIQRELQIALQGMTTTKLRLRGKDYNLVLKADTTYLKENVEKLYYFPILTPTGAVIPLKEIADFSYDYGPVQIDHENQSRVIKVLADIQGRKKSEVFAEIRDRLFKLSLPEGYSLQIKGEFEQVQDMIKNLGISIFAAIVLVYMILAAQLESLKDPIIIMLTIPLAFIGVILALWISGTTISVSSMVGALILVGVVVNQAIVMLTFYKELREKGVDPLEAVIQGSVTRLRPVLITNLTTIFGLIPMALSGHTEGGALRQPLAVAMIGGLTASTIMAFFVVPVIYTYFEKIKAKREE